MARPLGSKNRPGSKKPGPKPSASTRAIGHHTTSDRPQDHIGDAPRPVRRKRKIDQLSIVNPDNFNPGENGRKSPPPKPAVQEISTKPSPQTSPGTTAVAPVHGSSISFNSDSDSVLTPQQQRKQHKRDTVAQLPLVGNRPPTSPHFSGPSRLYPPFSAISPSASADTADTTPILSQYSFPSLALHHSGPPSELSPTEKVENFLASYKVKHEKSLPPKNGVQRAHSPPLPQASQLPLQWQSPRQRQPKSGQGVGRSTSKRRRKQPTTHGKSALKSTTPSLESYWPADIHKLDRLRPPTNSSSSQQRLPLPQRSSLQQRLSPTPQSSPQQRLSSPQSSGSQQRLSQPQSSGSQQRLSQPPSSGSQQRLSPPPSSSSQQRLSPPPGSSSQQRLSPTPSSSSQQRLSPPPSSGSQQQVHEGSCLMSSVPSLLPPHAHRDDDEIGIGFEAIDSEKITPLSLQGRTSRNPTPPLSASEAPPSRPHYPAPRNPPITTYFSPLSPQPPQQVLRLANRVVDFMYSGVNPSTWEASEAIGIGQSLEDVANKLAVIPNVLKHRNLTSEQLALSKISPDLWRQVMEGSPDPKKPPERLDLDSYREKVNGSGVRFTTTFDIDAAGLFSDTFDMIVEDVKFFPKPHYVQNIHLNIHYDVRFDYHDHIKKKSTTATVPIHKVPHVIFGQICSKLDCNIYLLFLDLYQPKKKFNFLNDALLKLLFEEVYNKALDGLISPSEKQKCTAAWSSAKLATMVGCDDQRQGHGGRARFHHVKLPSRIFGRLMGAMQTWISLRADLKRVFGRIRVFVNGKDFKDQTEAPSLRGAWERFDCHWRQVIDTSKVKPEQQFYDFGRITIANSSSLAPTSRRSLPAVTMLWKREATMAHVNAFDAICGDTNAADGDGTTPGPATDTIPLASDFQPSDLSTDEDLNRPDMTDVIDGLLENPFQEEDEEGAGALSRGSTIEDRGHASDSDDTDVLEERIPSLHNITAQYYNPFMLYDTLNTTFKTKAKSSGRKNGLLYGQMYSQAHKLFAVQKQMPLATRHSEVLLCNSETARHVRNIRFASVEHAFNNEKQFVYQAQENGNLSYATRMEIRTNGTMRDGILWEEGASVDQQGATFDQVPDHALAIPSDIMLRFAISHVNKFVAAFQLLAQQLRTAPVLDIEKTRVGYMLAAVIRSCLTAEHWQRQPDFWYDRHILKSTGLTAPDVAMTGMGLCKTMKKYGYGYFLERVNYTTWQFLETVRERVRFHIPRSLRSNQSFVRSIVGHRQITKPLDDALEALQRHIKGTKLSTESQRLMGEALIRYLVYLSLDSLRRYFWTEYLFRIPAGAYVKLDRGETLIQNEMLSSISPVNITRELPPGLCTYATGNSRLFLRTVPATWTRIFKEAHKAWPQHIQFRFDFAHIVNKVAHSDIPGFPNRLAATRRFEEEHQRAWLMTNLATPHCIARLFRNFRMPKGRSKGPYALYFIAWFSLKLVERPPIEWTPEEAATLRATDFIAASDNTNTEVHVNLQAFTYTQLRIPTSLTELEQQLLEIARTEENAILARRDEAIHAPDNSIRALGRGHHNAALALEAEGLLLQGATSEV